MALKTKHVVIGSAAIALAAAFITPFEGERLVPYQDIVGIWTNCIGNTHGVVPGVKSTHAECQAKLAKEVSAVASGLDKCITVPLPVREQVAYLSLAYNVGTGGVCRSNMIQRDLNHGLHIKACQGIASFNKAGGIVSQGLVNRRKKEVAECLG